MRSIKSRLEALEGKHGNEPTVLIIRDLLAECEDRYRLAGFSTVADGGEPAIVTMRRSGETDDELKERATVTATPRNGLVMLQAINV